MTTVARVTFVWVVVFIGIHVPWYLAGLPTPIPETAIDRIYTVVVLAMFAAGAALPLAMVQRWGRRIPRAILAAIAWFGAVLLLLRGTAGLTDLMLRVSGIAERGLTGLSEEEITGGTDPLKFDTWLGLAVDANFLLGGVLFTVLAIRYQQRVRVELHS